VVGEPPRGLVSIARAELLARAVAIGVHRGLGHAEFSRDLLGTQVPIDQPKAVPLPLGQPIDKVLAHIPRLAHRLNTLPARALRRLDSILEP